MMDIGEHLDPALRAANLALSRRKSREVNRLTSLELRFTDPENRPWEALAMFSVAIAALLFVLGVWFL